MRLVDFARRANQRGSALLIVVVFAALIAIALYKELPIAAFEAQRQKEELLVDRGNEYKHAVKLFVRKFGSYPASIDALENTNNIRCLRRRYADPFTHQQDWRLLHAGPGGILVDSKVKPALNGDTGSIAAPGSSGQSENGEEYRGSGPVVRPARSRPPAVPANSDPAQGMTENQTQEGPLLPPGQAARLTDNSPSAADATSSPDSGNSNTSAFPVTGSLGGGIAGVASNARGRSIRLVHEQNEYSLWEFYYDPMLDGGLLPFRPLSPDPGVNGNGAPGTVAPVASPGSGITSQP